MTLVVTCLQGMIYGLQTTHFFDPRPQLLRQAIRPDEDADLARVEVAQREDVSRRYTTEQQHGLVGGVHHQTLRRVGMAAQTLPGACTTRHRAEGTTPFEVGTLGFRHEESFTPGIGQRLTQ